MPFKTLQEDVWPSHLSSGCLCAFLYVCLYETEGKCVLERQRDFMKIWQLAITACTHLHPHAHAHVGLHTNFQQANISLRSRSKWGNRSKLFAYKLMKYYWVKLSWMLITKVMHYLLINESSLLGKRWDRRVNDQCGDTNSDSNKCRL